MRVGNRKDAQAIHDLAFDGWGRSAPEGFKALSGGGCRSVYANDEVVYKVQTNDSEYMRGYGNLTEYNHARALRNQSENGWIGRVYIPATSGYSFGSHLVIAMERIHGTEAKWTQSETGPRAEALWQLFMLGFGDMHAKNYMWLNSRKAAVAPIDMGSTRYRHNPTRNADRRAIQGTPHYDRLQEHDSWTYYNSIKKQGVAKSCPDGCGAVAWWV